MKKKEIERKRKGIEEENLNVKNKQIQNQVQEEAFIGLSKYYLALKDMSKEIETNLTKITYN